MPAASDLFTPQEQDQIIQAIQKAESLTSGEIRIHVEDYCRHDPLLRAEEIFLKIGMHKTRARNGVLIYIAARDKKLAIVGDKGINDLVGSDFWNEEKQLLIEHFKNGKYAEGVIKVIGIIGEELKKYFPHQKSDTNELSDDISFSKK
ncbi:MAG: hypothetical protein KatS3mg031_1355 [Chitinophagales bacterium]|nr:MAG: hypothetical protein KatS3mg031_1355 [Chitinophagales bacterium]